MRRLAGILVLVLEQECPESLRNAAILLIRFCRQTQNVIILGLTPSDMPFSFLSEPFSVWTARTEQLSRPKRIAAQRRGV